MENKARTCSSETLIGKIHYIIHEASYAFKIGEQEAGQKLLAKAVQLCDHQYADPNAPFPSPAIEGKEELDWLESFNREEVKNILMEFSYDFQQEKYGGCSTHRHIVSLFIKAHRELFSTPTPPAGAEGEREVPEEIHELVEQLWIKNGRTGSANGSFTNGASAMWRKMQEQAIAKNKKIFSLRERLRIIISNSEEFDRDYANCRQELSAAHTTIAELEAKVKDLQDWIHSHQ